MLEKVVAVTAAAGGLILSGAGMAAADTGTATTSSKNVVSSINASAEGQLPANGFWASITTGVDYPKVPYVPQIPQIPQIPQAPQAPVSADSSVSQQEKEQSQQAEEVREVTSPQKQESAAQEADLPRADVPRDPQAQEEHSPQSVDTATELAETGASNTALPLAAGAGLLIGGAVLYRRARVARR